jgi:hypothetical protein
MGVGVPSGTTAVGRMIAAGSKVGVGSGVGVSVGGGNGVGVEVGGCGVGDETGSELDVAEGITAVVAVGSGVSPILSPHATATVSSATSTTSSLNFTLFVPKRYCIWESVS